MRVQVISTVVGGVIWLGLIVLRLRSVDETLWIARDDAVITLSHARNAADFGSIGVSPGGDRVEGFSSPLHFVVAYLIELVSDPGYRAVSITILLIASALTGAFVAASLQSITRSAGMSSPRSEVATVALTAVAAAYVVGSWTSVGWIGSGMENPVVICAGMAVAFAAIGQASHKRTQWLLVIGLACFMVSRVEMAAFAMPVVFAAAWLHATKAPAGKQLRSFLQTASAALALVAFVHLFRRWYFGDWLPNTAVVQGRATGLTQLLAIALIALILILLMAIAFAKINPTIIKRTGAVADLWIITAVAVVGFGFLALTGRTGSSLSDLASMRALPALALLVAALLIVQRSLTDQPWIPNHVFAALGAAPLAQFVAMGPARLDGYRVAIIAVPFLAVWAVALSVHVVMLVRTTEAKSPRLNFLTPSLLASIIVVAMVAGVTSTATRDSSRRLNWEVGSAPILIDVVNQVRERDLAGGLALTANPDLGKVSYDKGAVITDLARLGDPLMTKIADERPDLVTTFLHFVAQPDVLEAHGVWACAYESWISSPEFAAIYTFSDDRWDDGRTETDDCGFGGRWAIWVRSDAEVEYQLTRDLLSAEDPGPVVLAALEECSNASSFVFRCQGVRRSLQRSSAALREAGTYGAAVDLMQRSPTAAFDLPMLRRDSGWASDASDAFIVIMNS